MRQEIKNAINFRAQQHDHVMAFFGATVVQTAGLPAGHDRLMPNQSLARNQALVSKNGRFKFAFQSDGNAVVYDGTKPLWSTDTAGKPVQKLVMQTDGNLVLYDPNGRAYWASQTASHANASLIMQDDNNLVMYSGAASFWSSRAASQHGPFDGVGHFLTCAVSSCGKAVGDGLSTVAGGMHDLQKQISSIKYIGGALATLYDLGTAPFTTQFYVANSVAHGEKLDKALTDNLSRLGKEVGDVLPWVASIVSIFPVFGPLVSTILMTAAALVQGQPLDEVLITAALSVIPGMAAFAHFAAPIIHFGIELAKAVASHTLDFSALILDGLKAIADVVEIKIPDFIMKAISIGVHFCCSLARGMKITDTLLQAAIDFLKEYGPMLLAKAYEASGLKALVDKIGNAIMSEAESLAAHLQIATALSDINLPDFPKPLNDLIRKVFGCATSLGSAAAVQSGLASKLGGIVGDLAEKGKNLAIQAGQQLLQSAEKKAEDFVQQLPGKLIGMAENAAVAEARKLCPASCQVGFDIAIGLTQHQCNPFQYLKIRGTLSADSQKGFDMAASLHIGRVAVKPHHKASHTQNAGMFITQGLLGQSEANKRMLAALVAANPQARSGAMVAIKQIAKARAADPAIASVVKETFWHKVLRWLGVHPSQTAVAHPASVSVRVAVAA